MIPCLIAQPYPTKSESVRRRHRLKEAEVSSGEPTQRWETSGYDEGRYIIKLVLMMLIGLVLPGILMLLYIVLTPDAF